MSTVPHRKFKQALLPFKKTTISPKKRKLDDEAHTDEAKCRKTRYNDSDGTDNTAVDVDNSESSKRVGTERIASDPDRLHSSQSTIDLDSQACNVTTSTVDSNQSAPEVNDESSNSSSFHGFDEPTSESDDASKTQSSAAEEGDATQSNEIESSDNVSKTVASDKNGRKIDGTQKLLPKSLTPKQLKKKQEAELKRQDRERLKQERERKKMEEKDAKEKKRLAELEIKNAEKRQKEEEKKAKEEEKRLKNLAKEEERKQKEEERKQKEEEKRLKEEEKRQRDEEKRQKEEEKRQKEEQERRTKEKTAAMFTNFFVKNKTVLTKSNVENVDTLQTRAFMPFEVKADMRLARICRVVLTPERLQYLDDILKDNRVLDKNCLYLAQLESKDYKPGHSENTWPLNSNDDGDVQIETPSGDVIPRYRCKLLQFAENRRPAYWGTWRKRSTKINGRQPFKCDQFYFQYDVDSDDEWVEEEPGESLHGSDDEKESEDEYEVDNDVFVPHGYLSDEEGQNDDVADSSPKSHKYKLNILEKEFEAEMNAKTRKLKPRIFGCVWISNYVEKNKGDDEVENLLLNFRAVWNEMQTPFRSKPKQMETVPASTCSIISPLNTPSTKAKKRNDFPESLLPDLIKLVHGNKINAQKLSEEFQTYALSQDCGFTMSKTCIQNKIKEISSWTPQKVCWVVSEDVRNRHNLGELSLENHWKYVGIVQANAVAKKIASTNANTNANKTVKTNNEQIATTIEVENTTAEQLSTPPKGDKTSPKIPPITKFMKILTPEEKAKQFDRLHPDFKPLPTSANNSVPPDTKEDIKQALKQNVKPQIKKRAVLFPVEKKLEKSNDDRIANNSVKCAEKLDNDDVSPLPLSFLPSKLSSFKNSAVEPALPSLSERANSNTKTKSLSVVEAMAVDDNCCQYSNHFKRPTENAPREGSESDREKQEMTGVASLSPKNKNAEVRAGKKYAKLITIGKVSME